MLDSTSTSTFRKSGAKVVSKSTFRKSTFRKSGAKVVSKSTFRKSGAKVVTT